MSQSERKSNKQLVDRALEEILPPALKPLICRKMEDKYGSNWLQNAQRSLEHYYFDGANLKWNDPAAVIKLLQKQFLQSVTSQIISRYNLPYPLELPPQATRDGKFLGKLLEEASAKLKSGEKLVIAVDALDEVDQTDHKGSNILYLPMTLPGGVYFVLTQRPITLPLNLNSPPH